jgi:rubrerythrin
MDDLISLTPEQFEHLRQTATLAAETLLAANADPEADETLAGLLAFLRGYCEKCCAPLGDPHNGACPSCGTVQEWVCN